MDQNDFSEDQIMSDLSGVNRRMLAFIQALANTMALNQATLSGSMGEDAQRVEVFKLAATLRTYHTILNNQTDQKEATDTLLAIQENLNTKTTFTIGQKAGAEVTTTCRKVIWDPSRTDFTNNVVVEAVMHSLESNRKSNGFQDVLGKSAPHTRVSALKSLVSVQASYIKNEYRRYIKTSLVGEGNRDPLSVTKMLDVGTRKFGCTSGSADVPHRRFARDNVHLLQKGEGANDGVSLSPGHGDGGERGFLGQLTQFFVEKESVWGRNRTTSEGWMRSALFPLVSYASNIVSASYIDQAAKEERSLFPQDQIPILPQIGGARNTSTNSLQTPMPTRTGTVNLATPESFNFLSGMSRTVSPGVDSPSAAARLGANGGRQDLDLFSGAGVPSIPNVRRPIVDNRSGQSAGAHGFTLPPLSDATNAGLRSFDPVHNASRDQSAANKGGMYDFSGVNY
ncbi:hypothetical protein H0H93_006194 [Arthromyces matolae]|nr:hypothetical protein H0H93_006194 [Arthromyces matolae]